jgi:hypothetical protein
VQADVANVALLLFHGLRLLVRHERTRRLMNDVRECDRDARKSAAQAELVLAGGRASGQPAVHAEPPLGGCFGRTTRELFEAVA